MAGNIFQQGVVPVKPKVLNGERIFVYVEEATNTTKGIASYDTNHFLVNAGHVILNTTYLSEAPFDRASLIKLDEDDFRLNVDITQINWPFAYDKSGSARANGFGLVQIADNSAGYLKYTDDTHYLALDIDKLNINIEAYITEHNNAVDAHPDIRQLITNNYTTLSNLIDTKVDKVAGDWYIGNTTNGIELSNDPPLPEGVIPPTTGIWSFRGLTINDNGITISDYTSGRVNSGAQTIFGHGRPKLKLYQEFAEAYYPEQTVYTYPNDGSPLATLFDVNKMVPYEYYDYNGGNYKISRVLSNGNLTLTSILGNTSNVVKLTPTTFTLNDKNIALEEYVDTKVAEINAVQVRNKEPNLVITATANTVQAVATQYIVDNYGRQPEMNDGLFITMTDRNNDVVKYAYFNGSWVNIGLNDIDLSNYVDKISTQTISGNKNFTGNLNKNGSAVATETYVDNEVEQVDKDARKVLILGLDGTIGTYANLVVQNAESFIHYRNNLTEFLMSVVIPVTGAVDLTKEVTIDFGDTSYYLFDASDTSKRLTLGDLNFALRENVVAGYSYLFRAIFFNNSDVVGFATLPRRDQVLSLNSDQMDNYIAEGGLPNGQLVICSRVITNGYTEGGIYRFKITYPDTYEFEELSAGGSGGGTVAIDNQTITNNSNNQIQAVALKDKMIVRVNNSLVTTNFNGLVELTKTELDTLETTGTVTLSNGTVLVYNDGTIYVTDGLDLIQELSLSQSGSVLTSLETFNTHVQIMVEFETEGMHYGVDFVLHPYDSSICLVSYNFVGHTGTAYLDENGYVVINVPDSLTFTNIKGHFVDLGG